MTGPWRPPHHPSELPPLGPSLPQGRPPAPGPSYLQKLVHTYPHGFCPGPHASPRNFPEQLRAPSPARSPPLSRPSRGLHSHTDGPHQQPRHLRAARLSTHPKTALLWGHTTLSFQANAHGNFQSFGQWATAKLHPLAFCRPNFRAKCLNPVTSIHCHLVFIEHLLCAQRCCEGSGFTTVARSPAPWSSHPRAGTRASLVWPGGNVCILPPALATLRASGHPRCRGPLALSLNARGKGSQTHP